MTLGETNQDGPQTVLRRSEDGIKTTLGRTLVKVSQGGECQTQAVNIRLSDCTILQLLRRTACPSTCSIQCRGCPHDKTSPFLVLPSSTVFADGASPDPSGGDVRSVASAGVSGPICGAAGPAAAPADGSRSGVDVSEAAEW